MWLDLVKGCGEADCRSVEVGANASPFLSQEVDAMHIQKQSVELTLDVDILRRAKGLTRNLDQTVETLLASFVESGETRANSEKLRVGQWVEWSNALIEQHGSPANEHSPLE